MEVHSLQKHLWTSCLELAGPLTIGDTTRQYLTEFAEANGELNFEDDDAAEDNQAKARQYAPINCGFKRVSIWLTFLYSLRLSVVSGQ